LVDPVLIERGLQLQARAEAHGYQNGLGRDPES
jgi:hypothetical protein